MHLRFVWNEMNNSELFYTCGQIVNTVSELKSIICIVYDDKHSPHLFLGKDIITVSDQNKFGTGR